MNVWLTFALFAMTVACKAGAPSNNSHGMALLDAGGTAHDFAVPVGWFYKSERVQGVRKSIIFDMPYKLIASQHVRSDWTGSLMVTLDVRPWARSPNEIMKNRIDQARFKRGSKRQIHGMSEYIAVSMEGYRQETLYYPSDLTLGIWEIRCLGGGEPYRLSGCTIDGEYVPGILMTITMPADHLSESAAFWERAKAVVRTLERA